MRSQKLVKFLCFAFLVFSSFQTKADEGFLDAMVHSGTTTVSTYGDILKFAEAKSGKKVEASGILQQWIALDNKVNGWTSFDDSIPLRNYLNSLTFLSDIAWRYDASKDVIVFDFAWHRPSDKPASELLKIVLGSKPPPRDYKLKERMADDAWRVAFDGLICKTEAADGAWMTRAKAGSSTMRPLAPAAVNYLCAGKIFDEKGREFAFVATHEPIQMSPGEGSIGFYLFDPEGSFVSGAVFSSGWRCSDVTGEVLADGRTLLIKGWHNGTHPSGTEYVIRDGKLVKASDGHGAESAAVSQETKTAVAGSGESAASQSRVVDPKAGQCLMSASKIRDGKGRWMTVKGTGQDGAVPSTLSETR